MSLAAAETNRGSSWSKRTKVRPLNRSWREVQRRNDHPDGGHNTFLGRHRRRHLHRRRRVWARTLGRLQHYRARRAFALEVKPVSPQAKLGEPMSDSPPSVGTSGRFGAYGGQYVPETLMPALARARHRVRRSLGRPRIPRRARPVPEGARWSPEPLDPHPATSAQTTPA